MLCTATVTRAYRLRIGQTRLSTRLGLWASFPHGGEVFPVGFWSKRKYTAWHVAMAFVLLSFVGSAVAATSAAPSNESSGDWLEHAMTGIAAEAANDILIAPAVGVALESEWRALGRDGSAGSALIAVGWVVIAAIVALLVERGIAEGLARWPRRRLERREGAPTAMDMAWLLACDLAGLLAFAAVFLAARRYVLPTLGITEMLGTLALNVLLRWRIAALIIHAILRPHDPIARLANISDAEARHLSRFVSLAILAVITLIGIARLGLMDEDNGASHVIGLGVAVLVCALYMTLVVHGRRVGEALIRGRRVTGSVGAIRGGLAHAWVPVGLILVAGLFLIFVAGLSLGLLSYYRAVSSTLGVLFVVLVLDGLAERVWYDDPPIGELAPVATESLGARSIHRIARALIVFVAALILASIWIGAIDPSPAAASTARHSATVAIGTLFAAFIV